MDLQAYSFSSDGYGGFLADLQSEIMPKFHKKVRLENRLSGIEKVIRSLHRELNRRIVFIFDEIDELIAFDRKHNYKLFKIFTGMAQKGYFQLITAGFMLLHLAKQDKTFPFYDSCEFILLTSLEKEAARKLVTEPMHSIGIHYENEEDIELILEYSACHPNLLQYFCSHLVEKIQEHERLEDRRTISRKDIDQLLGHKYESYILEDIYMFTHLQDIEKLLIVCMAENNTPDRCFSAESVKGLLDKTGVYLSIGEIYEKMQEMVTRFILQERENHVYCFALPVFPDILKKETSQGLKHFIIQDIQQEQGGQIHA
jgi:hypothetical protein